jgi:hypothetical protein
MFHKHMTQLVILSCHKFQIFRETSRRKTVYTEQYSNSLCGIILYWRKIPRQNQDSWSVDTDAVWREICSQYSRSIPTCIVMNLGSYWFVAVILVHRVINGWGTSLRTRRNKVTSFSQGIIIPTPYFVLNFIRKFSCLNFPRVLHVLKK